MTQSTRSRALAFTVLFVLLVGWPRPARAQAAGQGAQSGGQGAQATTRAAYVLGADDQIVIHAVDVPDISDKPQRVDPSGDLRLPVVGRVHAAGMTIEQLETELRDRLKSVLKEPDVTVTVANFHNESVSVVGAVGSPGVRPLEGSKTLIEILSLSGGPSTDAGPVVRISRRLEQGRIPLPESVENIESGFSNVDIPLKPLLDANTPEKNILIRPNDIVAVPRAEVVYVVGEVGKIGSVPVTRGKSVSVVEAISVSGGILKTGKGDSARIIRVSAGSETRLEIPVNVSKIMQGKSKDVPLFAGDILVVPNNPGRAAVVVALTYAIQAGVTVATYGLLVHP